MERRSGELERIKLERRAADDIQRIALQVVVIEAEQRALKKEVEKLVTRMEFAPIKLLVYGLAGTLLSGVIVGMLALVIRHAP